MKPMGATISENGYEQQKQHHQQQLQKQARRRRRKEKGPPIRRVRRQAQERLENLNEPNGRPRMGAIGRQPMRSGGGEQSVQGAAIHSNGHEGDGDRNIDGKLVAPLSWLDGAVVAPADSEAGPGLEPVEDTHRERRYDDIETARRGWPANGQQDLYPSNNANDDHDEVQLDHRHEMDIRHPNSGLPMVNSFDKRRASRASPLEFQAELSRHDEELEGDNLSNDSSQNSGSRHRRRRDTAADRSPTTNNANKQTSGDGAGVPGQGQRRRSAVAEQTRIPFNYANERNLNPHLEEVPAGRTTRRRHGARAQAIVESFDLHPETFDSGETTRAGRFKVGHEPGLELVETKAELAAVDTPVPDGRPSLAHLDKMALLHQQSQRIDIERASRRRQVVNSKSAGFEDGDLEGARQRRQGPTREMALAARLGPNWTPNPSVGNLIDNSDGRVNTLAIDVIDGNLETSQAADQDDSRHSDERPNEVSSQLEPTSTGQLPPARAGSGQLEAASKLFDSRDGDQTNSSSSSSSSFKSQRPDWPLPFGWISASEFVTEKSNIRMSEWAPRARRGKFNNIATVREPTTGKAAATPTESLTRRLDSDNFINFHRAAHKRHLEQQQQQQRAWRHGKRLLDDQSDRRRPPDGRNTRLAHDNDDALSIAGAVGGRRRRRQPYESQRESGHKLQLSRTEQRRRRFSRSDKSARSSGGVVASGPLRRHRRLASGAAGDQSDTEIPSAGRVQVIQATPPSGRGEGSTLRSISVQYESTTHGLDDDAEPARSDAVLDNLELQDEIVTSPGVREPPVMPNGRTSNVDNSNISTGDDDEEEDEQQEDEGEDDQDEDDDSIRGRLPGPMGNVGGTANDENLLWTAGQYLYMHMRAFAASSMYGVQVDVEWSNENEWMGINRTMDDGEQAPSSFPGELSRPDFNGSERVHGGSRDFGARTNAIAPIATIELVSGQDLHLQCTAQALGRLPEVNWYKRVERVPDHIPEEMRKQMVRSLGDDIFWPVTSLDLLDDESLGEPSENFVCSQSVTIFDNLLNQTFTVVNSLKLSEHSHEQTGGLNLAPTSQVRVEPNNERHHDLYACMVTADVRHECATLGVNIRHASSSKLPPGLSKRLLAHSMSELPSNIEPKRVPTRIIDVNEDLLREESNYDFLRQSQLVGKSNRNSRLNSCRKSPYIHYMSNTIYPMLNLILSSIWGSMGAN